MTRLVLDASVCLKWFLHERSDEQDVPLAMRLHTRVRAGTDNLIQPGLWRAEIAAGLARMLPDRALDMVRQFNYVDAVIDDTASSLTLATQIAVALRHHLFDTIYHAVAIEHGIDLITADEHYYRKAHRIGNIVLLRGWRTPSGVAEEPARYPLRVRKAPARRRKKHR